MSTSDKKLVSLAVKMYALTDILDYIKKDESHQKHLSKCGYCGSVYVGISELIDDLVQEIQKHQKNT